MQTQGHFLLASSLNYYNFPAAKTHHPLPSLLNQSHLSIPVPLSSCNPPAPTSSLPAPDIPPRCLIMPSPPFGTLRPRHGDLNITLYIYYAFIGSSHFLCPDCSQTLLIKFLLIPQCPKHQPLPEGFVYPPCLCLQAKLITPSPDLPHI